VIDLRCNYLGLALRSPIVASASPMTNSLERLRALEHAGVGAVVLPSLFEEEVNRDVLRLTADLDAASDSFPEDSSFFPPSEFDHLGPLSHLKLISAAKAHLSIPVIASVNGTTAGWWLRNAELLAVGGPDAIELNLYSVQANPEQSATAVEDGYLRLIDDLRFRVSLPLAVKLSPYLSSTANFARRLVDAGVDGLVLFNRFYQPDINLDTLDVETRVDLSRSEDIRLPLRWIGLLRPLLPRTSLALTSGVHTGMDVAKAILAGADVAMMASALLQRGAGQVALAEAELVAWMTTREYHSVAQMRGSVSSHTARGARAFERAQYIRTLASYPISHPT
jgi:dihydroorotate dehydrogenase (fumarate)